MENEVNDYFTVVERGASDRGGRRKRQGRWLPQATGVVAMENEVNDYFTVVEGAQATGRRRSMPCSRAANHARWLNLLQLTAPRSKSAVAVKMTARMRSKSAVAEMTDAFNYLDSLE